MDNILHVSFGGRRESRAEPCYKGDYGQVLVFDDIELPMAYEVHFSNNPEDGEAIGQIGNAEGVTIPNQYFLDGRDIYAWIFLHAGENDGKTRYMVRIPVRPRPDRSDEEPTPVQQSEIDQAIAALNAAVDAAEDAQEAAETAQGKAEEAQEAAETAQGKAEDAQEAAETAQGKAEDAQEAAETAQGKAEDAQEAAETAQGKAEDAQEAAETAQGKAEDAQEAAETAQGKAEDAQEAAETAQGKAEDAQEAAETAQGKAEDAQETAEIARDAILNMGVSASTLEAGNDATVTKSVDQDTGTVTLEFGIPKGADAPEELVEAAVEDWLNNHPEATTTVQDGAITKAKLNSSLADKVDEIDGKAPAIMDNSAKENSHTGLIGAQSITFHGNQYAFSNARYINARNYIPQMSKSWTADSGNLALLATGHFVIYNGTPTAKSNTYAYDTTLETPIPAGTYKFRIELPSALSADAQFILTVFYESAPSTRVELLAKNIRSTLINEFEFTTSDKAVKLGLKVGYAKNEVYSNYAVWMGIYDNTATVVDTELTVPASGTQEYANTALNSLSVIDTMQHESVVEHVVDTKTYVDAHTPDIIGFWNDHVYALPEDFGAVGDGVTDDTQAIVDCVAYSATSGKPVRGFNKYKITSTILINTRYQDVYLRYLIYTGNDAAIQLSDRYITLNFDVLESSGIGILFQRYSTQACQNHVVTGNRIKATGDCVKVTGNVYYHTVNIRYLESTGANCINFDNSVITGNIAEFVFRDSTCACPNGWVAKNLFGTKVYNFTVEANCLNGYLNPINCSFFGCRHREFTDSVTQRIFNGQSDRNNGPLIKYTVNPTYHGTHGLKYITADGIPWCCIDVSEVQGYEEYPQKGQTQDDPEWPWLGFNGIDVGTAIKGINASVATVYAEKMYFIGTHKVFVPGYRYTCTFDKAEYDMTLFEGQTDADILAAYNQGGWGTDFICGYSHTDYYMNASFGAVGYSDLTLTQQNGNTATIYDKLENVIFDGTNAGNGVWSLRCKVDRSKHGRCSNYTENGWWCYDGTNETWEVTKLS